MYLQLLLSLSPWVLLMIMKTKLCALHALVLSSGVAILIRIFFKGQRKLINMSTIIFMLSATLFILLSKQTWLMNDIALFSNGYLAVIVLMTLLINKPFTIEYAKEHVDKALWDNEKFIFINAMISSVWLIYFVINLLLNLISTYLYSINVLMMYGTQLALLCVVMQFSRNFPGWYIQHLTINFKA